MARKGNFKNNNRNNAINTANACEQAIKGLKSEINKEGLQKYFRDNKRYISPSKVRFERKKSTARKRVLANKRNKRKN